MVETTVSKPLYKILTELTGEQRFDVALHMATKDLVRLKLQEAEQQIKSFEQRYGVAFEKFQQAWETDQITVNTPIVSKKITGSGKLSMPIFLDFAKFLKTCHESE